MSVSPVDALFGELLGMFGRKFSDQWSSVIDGEDVGMANAKAVWAEKIRSNGLMRGDVRRGLVACERLKWPPTWGEFLELCSPSLDVDAALCEAIVQMGRRTSQLKDSWSSPAIYWAAVEIGAYDLSNFPADKLKRRFEVALRKQLEKGEIDPVPERRLALPAPGKSDTDRETGQRKIAEVASSIKVGFGKPGLMWARRAVERAAQGLPVAEAVLRDAQIALKAGEQ